MNETTQHIDYSRAGEPLDALPRCSGVYRFFDENGILLYVGKSVDIHSRVTQHLNEAVNWPASAAHIAGCAYRRQLTAGEIGAVDRERSD